MNRIQKTNIKRFRWLYIGGIILPMLLIPFMIKSPEYTWVLLIVGILHISILVIWGIKSKSTSFKLFAGERIQTAGYLHTLIGFSVAVTLLGTGKERETWLAPMGSALITSILGWSFGGEIGYKEDNSVDKAIEKIGKAFENLETKQIKTLDQHLNKLARFYRQQNKISEEKIENLVTKIQESNQSIIEVFNQLNSIIQEESDTLQQTFRQLNNAIENESESVPQSLRQLSSVIENQSDNLKYTFNQLSSVIEDNSYSFSANLKRLETESENAVDSMSDTAQSIQNFADNLRHILNLVEQLEEAIKYILENREKEY